MVVNDPNLAAAYYNFQALYQTGFQSQEPWYLSVATEVPSTTRENIYNFFGKLAKMREWIGPRLVHSLSQRTYRLKNKTYENTFGIPLEDFEDDQLGQWAPQIQNLGYTAAKWPDDLMKVALQSGKTTLCWDGQYFFDTDHPVDIDKSDSATYTNLYTSKALTPTNYDEVMSAMPTIQGEDGRELGIRPTHLVGPPQLRTKIMQILNAEMIAPAGAFGVNAAGGFQTNVLTNSTLPLILDELANEPTTWYLLDLSKPIRPFVFQMRKAPVQVPLISQTDPNVFHNREYLYGVTSRGAAGYALPFLAVRCEA